MILRLYILFLFFLLSLALHSHPVHISVTSIEYNAKKKHFLVAFKIFYDDLEDAIYLSTSNRISFDKDCEKLTNKAAVDYLSANFQIIINDKHKPRRIKFIRRETNNEAMWFYYNIPVTVKDFEKVTVINNIITDLYPDQTNLVILKIGDFEQGCTLNINNTFCNFVL